MPFLSWFALIVLSILALFLVLVLPKVLGKRGRRILGLMALFAVGLVVIVAALRFISTGLRSIRVPGSSRRLHGLWQAGLVGGRQNHHQGA
jgi:hypothetical protein